MSFQLLVLICSQLLFSVTDVLARKYMHEYGFTLHAFLSLWFALWLILKIIATVGFLYVLSSIDLGKSMALFGSVSILLSGVLGFLLLKEVLSIQSYVGITLAILAFIALANSN